MSGARGRLCRLERGVLSLVAIDHGYLLPTSPAFWKASVTTASRPAISPTLYGDGCLIGEHHLCAIRNRNCVSDRLWEGSASVPSTLIGVPLTAVNASRSSVTIDAETTPWPGSQLMMRRLRT